MLQYFGNELRVANRYTSPSGSNVNGEYVLDSSTPNTPVQITIVKPHPITGKELEALADGGHVRDYVKSWTLSDIAQQVGDVGPDVIGVDDEFFRVRVVYDRRPEGGALKFFMRRLSQDEQSSLDIYTG